MILPNSGVAKKNWWLLKLSPAQQGKDLTQKVVTTNNESTTTEPPLYSGQQPKSRGVGGGGGVLELIL